MGEVALICLTALIAQQAHQRHHLKVRAAATRFTALEARIGELERAKTGQYDHAAFEDLRTKVEGFRLAQGLKGSR